MNMQIIKGIGARRIMQDKLLPGQTFKRWTVIRYAGKNKWGNTLIECKCKCGKISLMKRRDVVGAQLNSCEGNHNIKLELLDLIKKKYGKLSVLEKLGKNKQGYSLYKCQCECGTISIISHRSLICRRSIQCKKCYYKIKNKKHGLIYHYLYHIWFNMRRRCTNPKDKSFKYYGARGITVDPRWSNIENFIYDIENYIGSRPNPNMQLDRINNDGNYELSNVRWATPLQNVSNRRCSIKKTK